MKHKLYLKKNVISFTSETADTYLKLAPDRGYTFFLASSPAVRINLFEAARQSGQDKEYIRGYCDAARTACKLTYKKRNAVKGP